MHPVRVRGVGGVTGLELRKFPSILYLHVKITRKTMLEMEVKILNIDILSLRDTLVSLGAKRVFEGEVVSVFLRNSRGDKIRLRSMGSQYFVTHKTPVASDLSKSNDELETSVGDISTMETILARTGFMVSARTIKYRESYELADARCEIDTVPGIPPYLEIEAGNESTLREAVEILGYDWDETSTMTERQVKIHYGLQDA
ncbi:MAG TPA: class IV adenylate cyclase [bacterium]|nr:class IV adenylate cyclase [bacterium]